MPLPAMSKGFGGGPVVRPAAVLGRTPAPNGRGAPARNASIRVRTWIVAGEPVQARVARLLKVAVGGGQHGFAGPGLRELPLEPVPGLFFGLADDDAGEHTELHRAPAFGCGGPDLVEQGREIINSDEREVDVEDVYGVLDALR